MMKIKITGSIAFAIILLLYIPQRLYAQGNNSNSNVESLTLGDCIDYALKNQPAVNQSKINVAITRTSNAISLAGWLPKINASGNAIHYFTLPTSLVSDSLGIVGTPTPVHTGVNNTVIPELSVSQAIFNPQLLYAARSAKLYVREAEQVNDSTRIFIVTNVSKAFYNLLLT